ncbi:hypothetical protein HZC07_03065 [Candidatus Micrarchaeota archaeon]|nr:hypothetical protein [Candidatus Micrarchaeota archaeon]
MTRMEKKVISLATALEDTLSTSAMEYADFIHTMAELKTLLQDEKIDVQRTEKVRIVRSVARA